MALTARLDRCHIPGAMTLPAGYIDRFPGRGPWAPAAEPPPKFAFTTEILLADGATTNATWTGALWWGFGFEVKPIGWRWVHNPGMSVGPKATAAA